MHAHYSFHNAQAINKLHKKNVFLLKLMQDISVSSVVTHLENFHGLFLHKFSIITLLVLKKFQQIN